MMANNHPDWIKVDPKSWFFMEHWQRVNSPTGLDVSLRKIIGLKPFWNAALVQKVTPKIHGLEILKIAGDVCADDAKAAAEAMGL